MVPAGVLVDAFCYSVHGGEGFGTSGLVKNPFGLEQCKAFQL